MEHEGVPVAALEEEGAYAAKLQQLMNEGIDPDKIARGVALAAAIDALVADRKLGDLTPQEIAALIDKGLAVPPPKPAEDSEAKKGHNWPPIINLSEAGGYYFATGSAELTPSFATELRTVVVDKLLGDRRFLRRRRDRGDRPHRRAAGERPRFQPRPRAVVGDLGNQRRRRPAMGRQCRAGPRARALGGRAIVGRSAPARTSASCRSPPPS